MELRLISSEKILFKGEVESVTLPGTLGRFTVLEGHAPLISTLQKGEVTYVSEGTAHETNINGGFVEVNDNIISVCIS